MKNRKTLPLLLAGTMTAALLAVPTQAGGPNAAARTLHHQRGPLEPGVKPRGTWCSYRSTPSMRPISFFTAL